MDFTLLLYLAGSLDAIVSFDDAAHLKVVAVPQGPQEIAQPSNLYFIAGKRRRNKFLFFAVRLSSDE
jgi:hypothetical protein